MGGGVTEDNVTVVMAGGGERKSDDSVFIIQLGGGRQGVVQRKERVKGTLENEGRTLPTFDIITTDSAREPRGL